MITFAHSGHDHGAELTQAVAGNTTADAAYFVCVISFTIAGILAIYLLWDKTRTLKAKPKKAKVAKKATKKPAKKK